MKKAFALAGLALALAVAVPVTAYSQQTPGTGITMGTGPATVGQLAPDVQIQSTINGDGRTSLADFRGEVVFLEMWGTHWGPCRGQVGHLTKLQEEFGKKGLTVIGLTGDDRKLLLQYMAHQDANFGYTVATGGSSDYPSAGIPHSALIRADGTVAYVGHPGSMSAKLIEDELKKVKKPTVEDAESKAAKMLAAAEANIAKKNLLVAESVLTKIVAKFPASESGKKAAARAKEISVGDFKAEYDAQKDVAKLIGGSEKPVEKDSKKFQKIAKVFEKKAAEYKDTAPVASALAAEWAEIAANPWK